MAGEALPQPPGVLTTDPQPPRTKKLIYTPLADNEIRLAVLRPSADFDEAIRVDLITATWPPPLPYEALSYVWGDAAVQSTILIESVGGPSQPYSVTTNLGVALRHLRREDRDRPMWIDALCINQSNVEEKEKQISKMDQIYQAAYKVCVWLGPGSDVSDRAMAAVPNILLSISHNKRLSDQDWELFAHLLRREWFSRRWVVQEIALAKAATVRCGRKVVSWTDFSDAISMYVSRQASTWSSVATALVASELGASTLSSMSDNALRKDGQGNIIERRWPIEDLLGLLPMFQAQVPHDAIYALLSVASDSAALPPVDYSKPPAELFTEVFQHIVKSSKSLDMMFRPWAPEIPGRKLPSFIMPASRRTHLLGAGGLHERRNADSLVAHPRRRIYSAAPYLTPVATKPFTGPRYRPSAELEGLLRLTPASSWNPRVTLSTRGVICAIITEVSGVCENGIIPQDWLEAWRDQPDIWRVLVAGRSRDGAAAPNWYRRAFDNLVASSSSSELGLNLPEMIKASPSSNMTDFLHRVSACVWERRLLVSTRERPGYFGLVPREAAPGDMICLLEGCSVPVVFRGKPGEEWVQQALETVPQRYLESESLAAYMEEQIAEALRDGMLTDLENLKKPRKGARRGISKSFLDAKARRSRSPESQRVAEFTNHLEGTLLPPRELEAQFREMFRSIFNDGFIDSLVRLLRAALGRSTRFPHPRVKWEDQTWRLTLERFFRGLMRASLRHLSSAVLLPEPSVQSQNPSWADAPLDRWFQPCLGRAYEQAAEWTWGDMASRMIGVPELVETHFPFYSRILEARGRAFNEETKAAWSKAQERVLVDWNGFVAGLSFEELGIGTCEGSQNAVKTWIEKTLGETAVEYGGGIVGECYVHGLMDGEWWNAGSAKEQEMRTFVIA
jgi:hypothetical protein